MAFVALLRRPARHTRQVLVARAFARWRGELEIPGAPLLFVVSLPDAGSADAPAFTCAAQGLLDIPVEVHSPAASGILSFSIPKLAAAAEVTPLADGGMIGTWTQPGVSLPLTLSPLKDDEAGELAMIRTQLPKPPFPYDCEDVEYRSSLDGCKLAGTLTLPRGSARAPAVLLLTGSGAHDRDESIFGHKPFFVLADYLTRRGVAVLRVDDRTVGGSERGSAELVTDSSAADAVEGLNFLRGHARIDGSRVGLLGHSEGGLTAALAAARAVPSFIVLMAGPGVSGRETLCSQNRALVLAAGGSEAQANLVVERMTAVVEMVRQDAKAEDPELRRRVEALVQAQCESMGQKTVSFTPSMIDAGVQQLTGPWIRRFIELDPYEYLSRITCPVLALCGTKDVQVIHDVHLPRIEDALKRAGVKHSVIAMPGLNHLMQRADTGKVEEYVKIEHTIDEDALKLIGDWVDQVTTVGA